MTYKKTPLPKGSGKGGENMGGSGWDHSTNSLMV